MGRSGCENQVVGLKEKLGSLRSRDNNGGYETESDVHDWTVFFSQFLKISVWKFS